MRSKIAAHGRVGGAFWVPLLLSTVLSMPGVIGVGSAIAQDPELLILSANAHEWTLRATASSEGGIDLVTPFEKAEGVKVTFNIQPLSGLQEGLQRLGPLPSTAEDIIFVHQFDTTARLEGYLEPLDGYLDAKPIPGFPSDWAPGVAAASVFDGKRYLVPMRCGAMTLWYNDALFAERSIAGPPKVPEDIYEIAKAATFTRPDGEKVFGVAFRGDAWSITEDLSALARSFGGDIVDAAGKVVVNQPPAVAAVNLLKRLLKEGLMPPNWATMDQDAVSTLFRDGRAALVLGGASYGSQYNDGKSQVNGHAVAARWPLVAELQTADRTYGAGTVYYWGLGILKGSQHKEQAADFIRHISTPESVHALAGNGSGACTTSELADQAKTDPAMQILAEIFSVSRTPLPVNSRINQIRDLLGQTIQNIVVNDLDTQSELDTLAVGLEQLYR